MNIHKNEITTGILVLVTLAGLIAVLVVIGMPGLIKPLNTYRIYYDNAKGIRSGDAVLLAGREIGKVKNLESPVPADRRPKDHPEYEVAIDVQVSREAPIYKKVTVQLTQYGLMGQMVIDFVKGDETSGLAENGAEFTGERVPDLSESVNNQIKRLTEPGSDLAEVLRNVKEFTEKLNGPEIPRILNSTKELMEKLNQPAIPSILKNTEQMTDTLKREPWRLIWPSSKKYGDEKESLQEDKKTETKRRGAHVQPARG